MLEAVKPVLLEKVDNILWQSKSGIVFALHINLSQSVTLPVVYPTHLLHCLYYYDHTSRGMYTPPM
jgi:hypothetical protein